MAYYNYKELRDALPPEMVDKWAAEDGSADYDSTLWSYGAEYIARLTKERDEARKIATELRDLVPWSESEPWNFPWENVRPLAPADTQTPKQNGQS